MSVYKDKEGIWHVTLCVDRQRLHKRLPRGSSEKDAKKLEGEIRRELSEPKKAVGDPLLFDVMALYMEHAKTLRSEKTAVEHATALAEWLDGRRASETQQVVAKIIRDMSAKGFAVGTINRRIGTLKKALRLAWEEQLTPENCGARIRRMPENNAREVFLSMADVKTIADHASENVRAAIWIAVLTGMRRGEILKIKREDIQGDVIIIPAGNTKTLRKRVVPITEPLRPLLKYIPFQINFEGLKTGFQRARKKAGMDHVNFHDLRHSCASLLIECGTDIETVSRVLGHTTTRMTERYVHVRVDRQREALRKAFGDMSPVK